MTAFYFTINDDTLEIIVWESLIEAIEYADMMEKSGVSITVELEMQNV